MTDSPRPIALVAAEAPLRTTPSSYPEPFASMMAGREKRPLGDLFGLRNFGVNLTRLKPGALSSLQHLHSVQDEFIYVLEGTPTLVTDAIETLLGPGQCAGFAARGVSHQLVNRSDADVVYLEIGDRLPGDCGSYPQDDLQAVHDGARWRYTHKDGSPY